MVQLFRAKSGTIYFNCDCGNQPKFRPGTVKHAEANALFPKAVLA